MTDKIKAVSINFPFSESNLVDRRFVFTGEKLWEDASHHLALVPPPLDGSYYKTDFVITYENGETYTGRYDIGSDQPTLGEHMRYFLGAMTFLYEVDERWDDANEIKDFRNTFEIGY